LVAELTARLDRLCRDLFLLAQLAIDDADRGARWERRVAAHANSIGMPTETHPGGCSFMGRASLSGLRHQIDAVLGCDDAIVIGEWKAHRGAIAKNELLRFKAVSDDYYLALGTHLPGRPIVRLFGGTGRISADLRRYAALWGIALIDPEWWPSPTLASARTGWPGSTGPSTVDRRQLGWLTRPLQRTLSLQADGSYRLPRPPSRAHIDATVAVHAYWSDELWQQIDATPGRFERLIFETCQTGAA
jgi:hypothetical protein